MKINKIYRLFAIFCITMLCSSNILTAQSNGTEVSVIVIDEQGKPLHKADVFGPNGSQTSTDANGKFKIALSDDGSLVIQKKGYETELVSFANIADKITLKKSLFLASEDDEIKMGVITRDRRDIIGAVSSVRPEDRLTFDNTQFVRNYINGLMLGVRGSSNVRGLGNAIFVIDGVFGRNPNYLNMDEVEQITVLRDANAVALYGSQGRNGVIVINTKRGEVNKKEFNVNVITGFRLPLELPNYLGSADYMELFNEALANDGQPAQFLDERIANTRSGVNPFAFPDVDFYSNEYVKPLINTVNIITEFSGGNEKSQYYVNAGWNREESWENISPDANKGRNRFNIRGNIDFRVNNWITSSIDGIAILDSNKSAFTSLLNAGTTFKPFEYAPLLPVNLLDVNTPFGSDLIDILGAAQSFNGFLLGANLVQGSTPVAEAIGGGTQENIFRVTQFNNTINFDLSAIAEGLTAKTYLSFDFFDSYREFVQNRYITYNPIWDDNNEKIIGLTEFGENVKDQIERVSTNDFVSRLAFYGLLNYKKTYSQKHSINSTLLAYYNTQKSNNVLQTDKDAHIGFQATYDYKKKFFADFSGTYAHSIKLPEGNRGGFSPTAGVAYILSEEPFLKDNTFINYLKIKATAGIIKSDIGIGGYYLYQENYTDGSTFTWDDDRSSNRRQNITQGANPNMTFEERIDLNLGFETQLMNSLWIDFNYFRTELDKQLGFLNAQYPSFFGTFRPRDNFNSNLYTGFELGVNFNKSYNDFSVAVGANILYSQTEVLKRSEINEFAYQNRVGTELSTIFGLEDQGFYGVSDFTQDVDGNFILNSNLPEPNFGDVQPGDIKYRDQNGDNIIDNDDIVAIGQGSSPWTYGVNVNLKYKNLNLFLLGTAQTGADGNRSNNYFRVDGNDKYSEVVLGRWTPETASTATFPRLSSVANQNNFRNSTFWLYDNSFFRLNRIQLTYEFDDNVCKSLGASDLSLNFQGNNIFEISKNREIRQLNIGGTPQTKAYTFGARISF